MTTRILLTTAATILLTAGFAHAQLIKVGASVDGVKTDTIGSINVSTGKDLAADNLSGLFTIEKDYAALDAFYDFRWVNILTGLTIKKTGKPGTEHPLLGKLPGIDPSPKDGAQPYYYNAAEWKAGKFGSKTIREEGNFSLFDDSPNSGQFSDLNFETYLVVANLHDPNWKDKEFCVLAGFSWSWKIGTKDADKDSDWDDDVSTFGASIAIDDDSLKRLTSALANAVKGGDFKGWSAVAGSDLMMTLPTPGTLVLASLGGLLAIRRRR